MLRPAGLLGCCVVLTVPWPVGVFLGQAEEVPVCLRDGAGGRGNACCSREGYPGLESMPPNTPPLLACRDPPCGLWGT